MFVVRKDQLEVFRILLRQKKKEELLLKLQCMEGNKVFQEKNKIVVKDKKGRDSILHYSDKNLLSSITKPSGLQVNFDYDDDDRISKVGFPGNETLQLTYANDVPNSISLNGANTQLKYDSKSRLNQIVHPDKISTYFQYNDLNQVSAVVNKVQSKQSYQTSIEDNRLVHRLKDSLGRTTTLRMDTLGGLEKIIFPDHSTYDVRYDEAMHAEIVKLRNGTYKTTYFDGIYPYKVEWEDGSFQEIEVNNAQQIEFIENQTGIIDYEYDEQQRPLSESFQDSRVTYKYEDEYLKSITYPSGLEVEYGYDEDDRLKNLTVAGLTVEYKYATNGTLAQIHYPNGLIEHQTSQVLGGLQETKLATQSGAVISKQVYGYDKLSRLVRQHQLDTYSEPKDWTFDYDEEGRLTQVAEDSTHYFESFRYDIKGNINQVGKEQVEVGLMDEVRRIGNKLIEYDRDGNITKFIDEKGRKLQLTYSDEGRLKFARINEEEWEYWYDALGRRVGKSNGKETYTFFWAGEKLLSEEHKIGNEATVREYIYTDSNIPIAFKEGEELYWLQQDVRGAITDVFDNNGKQVWKATYTAFGNAKISISTIHQPWRLAGQYYDEETGLHYNFARYYSPCLRTFLSLDPKWFKYEATNYSYAANDPYNRIDINGNLAEWIITSASIGAGIVAGVAVGAAAVALAPAAAATIVGVIAIGAIAGGVGAITESVISNMLKDEPICVPCALKSGAIGAAIGAVLGPVGKYLGKALAPYTKNLLSEASKPFRYIRARYNRIKIAKSLKNRNTYILYKQRRKFAKAFYAKHNPGMSKSEINSHINGIDFTKPIAEIDIHPGDILYQFQKQTQSGKRLTGNYFATDKNSLPSQLGISDVYNVKIPNPGKPGDLVFTSEIRTVESITVKCKSSAPIRGLRTTSKPIKDHWNLKDSKVHTEGSAEQIYIPDANRFF